MDNDKAKIIAALRAWINQRPRLRYADYGEAASYRREARRIGRQLEDARRLIRRVEVLPITGEALAGLFRGRLTWDGEALEYTAGQYWPTEYRAAAARVCADALWDYYREGRTWEQLQTLFREQYGKRIHSAWF